MVGTYGVEHDQAEWDPDGGVQHREEFPAKCLRSGVTIALHK